MITVLSGRERLMSVLIKTTTKKTTHIFFYILCIYCMFIEILLILKITKIS